MNEPSVQVHHRWQFPKDIRHINGLEFRQTHSTYGLFNAAATYIGSIERNNPPHIRGFVMTRSYYVGVQKFAWSATGDNEPIFQDLKHSIPMMTMAGLSGPFWNGADVGGHRGNVTEELLVRWFQVAAWTYTLFREHNTIESAYREPFRYKGDTFRRLVKAINDRYSMIALWYTWTMSALWNGRGPIVPLWYEWPAVHKFHSTDIVCLLGDSILVAPVTEHEQKTVSVPKPPGVWYDFWTGREFTESQKVSVTMDDIPIYIRGGKIVPWYAHPTNTTIATIITPLTLYIAEDENGSAEGSFYLDDGTTFNATMHNIFVHRHIHYASKLLAWTQARFPVEEAGVPDVLRNAVVESLVFYGRKGVSRVTGLALAVCDVWTWRKGDSGVYRSERRTGPKSSNRIGLVFFGVAAGVVVIAAVVVLARRFKYRNAGVDSLPLVRPE
jgi:alpha-glucosidase (family GH31 glycosyl hydrolase)